MTCQRYSSPANRDCTNAPADGAQRRGSVLLIVVVLLTMLMALGFFIYTIAAQEAVNAEYFADAAKETEPADPEELFNFALRQLILGAERTERNSMFWGGRNSLLPTMFGRDLHPYSGTGVNLMWDTTNNVPVVDMDYNATADAANQHLLSINVSPGALGSDISAQSATNNLRAYPEPDADYTSADINSTFLSYDAWVPNPDGTSAPTRLIIPSFVRPQLLRNMSGVTTAQWYTNAATKSRVLRPHTEQQAVASNGTISTAKRFVTTAADATALGITSGHLDLTTGIQEGLWSNPATPNAIQYDVDTDGDGIKESIYLDLDYPLFVTADGTQTYVPMVAMKVMDADALFNLNAHGNLAARFEGTDLDLAGNPFGGANKFISRSNQAVGVDEVNPQWGLYARPLATSIDFAGNSTALDAVLEQHRMLFGHNPTSANSRELANMEFWWMLAGRAQFQDSGMLDGIGVQSEITTLYQGRLGETPRLRSGNRVNPTDALDFTNFPQSGLSETATPSPAADDNSNEAVGSSAGVDSMPGTVSVDDDQNSITDDVRELGWQATDDGVSLPLDRTGSGRTILTATFGKQRELQSIGRYQWPIFRNFMIDPMAAYRGANAFQSGLLLPGATIRALIDEPSETRIEPAQAAGQTTDSIFGADQNASLHFSTNDLAATNTQGRVLNLAPFNLVTSLRNTEIRQQFTTTSWDVATYGKAWDRRYLFGPDGQPGVAGVDDDSANGVDDIGELGYGGSDDATAVNRGWEFNADQNGDGRPEFPPQFGTVVLGSATDPIRSLLRNLLKFEVSTMPPVSPVAELKVPQHRLSINGVLDLDLTSSRLKFRPLTAYPVAVNVAQELKARQDRQRMARDIYVLLYTLGGGNDAKNYATITSPDNDNVPDNTHAYTPFQLKEMAQFAVNMVDRLDPDDVITRFEYDMNLSDGWGLDDDPDTNDSNPPDRAVVFGVEAQKLTLNEAMVAFCPKDNTGDGDDQNDKTTEWKESDYRDFVYIELANVQPRPVNFTNNAWQIEVIPRPTAGADALPGIATVDDDGNGVVDDNSELGYGGSDDVAMGEIRYLTLAPQSPPAADVGTGVAPNSLFVIGTAGDTHNVDPLNPSQRRPSFMMVDPNAATTPTVRVAPRGALNLDLIPTTGESSVYIVSTDEAGTTRPPSIATGEPTGQDLLAIDVLQKPNILADGHSLVTFKLRRLANLNHAYNAATNPWVDVDTLSVPIDVFTVAGDTAAELNTELNALKSRERTRPLAGLQDKGDPYSPNPTADGVVGTPALKNSLGQENDSPVLPGRLYQPHFDRDYASVAELFDVPLYGPEKLTEKLWTTTDTGVTKLADFIGGPMEARTAGSKFLQPDNLADANVDNDNRWYRVLDLLEVPADKRLPDGPAFNIHDAGRADAVTTDLATVFRLPGKINLNTLRQPAVLGGLLDDTDVINLYAPTASPATPPYLADASGEAAREWWLQFIESRDGSDPLLTANGGTNNGTYGLPLPGLPTAKPFRPLGYWQNGNTSLEHTIFRSLPKDVQNAISTPVPIEQSRRRLFEVGALSEDLNRNGSLDGGEDAIANGQLDDDPLTDYTTRHRLLAKVMNNSTTRSNVFLVFMQLDYFEAKEVDDGGGNMVVRIGAKLATSPGYRAFFVIDRSKALGQVQQQDLPVADASGNFTFNFKQTFDYKSLVLHRQRIK